MKYKAIIFDMDGTIVHSNEVWNEAIKTLLSRRGITLSSDQEQELAFKLCGLALPESCRILKEMHDLEDEISHLMKEKSNLAQQFYQDKVNFIDGFVAFHELVVSLDLKIGLATNADDATLHATIKRLKLETFFGEHMYNISHVNNRFKPDPAVYLHAAEQLGVDPRECIAIEDSAHGVVAAVTAGMYCIGINTSKNPKQTERAHQVIDHYQDIDLHHLLEIKIKK